jgi:hypothetical protein
MRLNDDRHQPVCIAAHDCINKLAAIVSGCDLLLELTKPGTELQRRVEVIRSIAKEGVDEMKRHQHDIPKAG